jgi:hypothetical protein
MLIMDSKQVKACVETQKEEIFLERGVVNLIYGKG